MGVFAFGGNRLRIISKSRLREFWRKHPEAEGALIEWYRVASKADWKSFAEVRNTFRHADPYCDCVIFDIRGNDIRLITIILYPVRTVYVRYVMAHGEYDKGKWKDDCNC
jgi:mRNA interferase HigB